MPGWDLEANDLIVKGETGRPVIKGRKPAAMGRYYGRGLRSRSYPWCGEAAMIRREMGFSAASGKSRGSPRGGNLPSHESVEKGPCPEAAEDAEK